jgi:hypothetical protein
MKLYSSPTAMTKFGSTVCLTAIMILSVGFKANASESYDMKLQALQSSCPSCAEISERAMSIRHESCGEPVSKENLEKLMTESKIYPFMLSVYGMQTEPEALDVYWRGLQESANCEDEAAWIEDFKELILSEKYFNLLSSKVQ